MAIRLRNGKRVTLTNTCAANVLGLVKKEHFSYGNVKAARKAMAPLAEYLNLSIEETATAILEKAFEKIEPVIMGLARKYKLEKEQLSLVGVGGGASSLLSYCAEKMELNYSIPENAEVISSIGVALSMVQDVVERIIPNPSKQEIQQIRNEALNKAIESGAVKETVEVHINIDSQTQKVTAMATGSTEVQTCDLSKQCTLEEARDIAENDFRRTEESVELLAENRHFYIFGKKEATGNAIRVIDNKGFIKVQRGNAQIIKTSIQNYLEALRTLWEDMANYKSDLIVRPDFYICAGARLMDFATQDFSQLMMLVDLDMASIQTDEELLIIACNQQY